MSRELPILDFVLTNYKNFNARATRDALVAYWRHIDAGGKMFWAVAGAMSSAQLGITLAPAIRAGLVHGHVGDRRQPGGVALPPGRARPLQGLPRLPLLHQGRRHAHPRAAHAAGDRHQHPRGRGLPRGREVHRPDVDSGPARAASAASGTSTSTSSSRRIGPELYQGEPEECWLLAAARASLPIVVPGHEDSTFGNIFASHVKIGECQREHREVGHRVHGHLLRPVPRALLGRRAWASSRSAAASPATSRSAWCRRSSTTSSEPVQALGVLLPDQRLHHLLRLLLRAPPPTRRSPGTSSPATRRCS